MGVIFVIKVIISPCSISGLSEGIARVHFISFKLIVESEIMMLLMSAITFLILSFSVVFRTVAVNVNSLFRYSVGIF